MNPQTKIHVIVVANQPEEFLKQINTFTADKKHKVENIVYSTNVIMMANPDKKMIQGLTLASNGQQIPDFVPMVFLSAIVFFQLVEIKATAN